jgi:hypothetical protein
MVRDRFDADHLVPIRLLRLDPLGIGRQNNGESENSGFLHAQVSTNSWTAPKKRRTRYALALLTE